MTHPRTGFVLALALVWLCLGPVASPARAAAEDQVVWSAEAKVTRMFDSHTSYEFGQPFPPQYAPLSRLEFALNTWWAGVELTRWTPRWSVSLRLMRNLTDKVDGLLADSDWDDTNHPRVRTIYSESDLRLKPCYDARAAVDVSLKPWLGLPAWLDLRPVAGLRWQRLDFLGFNMRQWVVDPDDAADEFSSDAGDCIRFRQMYWHYFVGLKLELRPMPRRLPGLRLGGQLDWAHVKGDNRDHHLLRAGNRVTEESTAGDAWHASLTLEAPIGGDFFLALEGDYLIIDTSGGHRLSNEAMGLDFTVDNGVRVWSQQCGATLSLRYYF